MVPRYNQSMTTPGQASQTVRRFDRIVSPRNRAGRTLSAANFVVIDGADHTLVWTHSDELVRVTDEFDRRAWIHDLADAENASASRRQIDSRIEVLGHANPSGFM